MHFSWISRLTALGETFSAEREAKGGEGGSLPNVLRDDQADGARSESNARGKEVLAEERLLIFQALMKCSDISNPVRFVFLRPLFGPSSRLTAKTDACLCSYSSGPSSRHL
jgi:hypothetical protein